MRYLALLAVVAFLAGCSSAPPVPADHFYRLPFPKQLGPAHLGTTDLDLRLGEVAIVQPFRSTGLHNERALLYSDDPGGLRLKRYHYHLWTDAPPKLLQEQLAAYLRRAKAARLVRTSSGPIPNHLITGHIYRFEQHVKPKGREVFVELELGVERPGEYKPFVSRRYATQKLVSGDAVKVVDVVAQFGAAVDEIYSRFLTDLADGIAKAK
ncbi:MAG: hypothetical protein AAF493_15875 [Pseudomonadota bacterium]